MREPIRCPFCGMQTLRPTRVEEKKVKIAVLCETCGAIGPPSTLWSQSVEQWNDRQGPGAKDTLGEFMRHMYGGPIAKNTAEALRKNATDDQVERVYDAFAATAVPPYGVTGKASVDIDHVEKHMLRLPDQHEVADGWEHRGSYSSREGMVYVWIKKRDAANDAPPIRHDDALHVAGKDIPRGSSPEYVARVNVKPTRDQLLTGALIAFAIASVLLIAFFVSESI